MEMLETRGFRILLTILTIIVLFVVLRQWSSGETVAEETRTEAVDTTDTALTPVITPEPTAPVIIQTDPVESVPENVVTYPVQAGDTVNDIAIKFNISFDAIMRANPSLDPNKLQIGQKLRLPGVVLDPEDAENPGPDRDEGVTVDYYVQVGDTLGNIATEYDVSLQALLDANPDFDPALIQVGQRVIVPPKFSGLDPAELTPVPTITPIPRAIGEAQTVLVQPGDTLNNIATAWGVTLDALMGANNIQDADNIFVGLELLIPAPPAQ